MSDNDEYLSTDAAAKRLRKTASQVRRDVRSNKLHFIEKGGRIWVRVDERFRAMETNPGSPLPPAVDSGDRAGAAGRPVSAGVVALIEELIEDVRDLKTQVAHLKARVQRFEAQ